MRKAFYYPRKLFTLMMFGFIGFSALVLSISGAVYYGMYSELAYREVRDAKEELLNETSQKLSNYVKSIQDTAVFLVTNKTVQQHLSQPPESLYDYVTQSRELYESFQKLVAVKDGVVLIALYSNWQAGYPPIQDQFLYPLEQAEEEGWLERLDASDGFWMAAPFEATSEVPDEVSYVHRIPGVHGETLGIVKINIPQSKLFSLLERPGQDPDAYGHYVIHDARAGYVAASLPEDIVVQATAAEMRNEVAGTRYSVIESQTPGAWKLMQLIPKDVLRQSLTEIRGLVIGLFLLLVVLSVPLAYWVTRRLTAPIYRLVAGMQAVERGDFEVRLVPTAPPIQEYLYMTTHFNRMVTQLRDSIQRLHQEHRERRAAEIHLLHAQIKPHFLYNTLDLIHWRALDYKADDISGMVQQLSKLFRLGLGNDKWYTPLRDELLHARCYMSIQAYRQRYPIDYQEQVESELFDTLVPKVIIQPFLENAVIHGYRHWEQPALIHVAVQRVHLDGAERLELTIRDRGRGLPADYRMETSSGIGVRNVSERIRLYCGSQYGVAVRPAADGDGGTLVTVWLPLVYDVEEMEQLTRSLADEYDSLGG